MAEPNEDLIGDAESFLDGSFDDEDGERKYLYNIDEFLPSAIIVLMKQKKYEKMLFNNPNRYASHFQLLTYDEICDEIADKKAFVNQLNS